MKNDRHSGRASGIMNNSLHITIVIILLFNCYADAPPSFARNPNPKDVEEIIQGFDDEVPESAELEDLMQGFEDEPGENLETPLEDDEILRGFEEEEFEQIGKPSGGEKPASWSLDGEFTFTTTYNFSSEATPPWRGFTMLRPELELLLKNKFSDNWQGQISVRGFYDFIYVLRGRDEYTPQVLSEYEKELELEDTFIQGRLTDRLDTKIGRQIVVWGTLDNLRVTDVLNPLDLRVPGLTDIDDLRLPVTMVKFDYYFGNWALSGMAIPEVRFSKLPVFGSDFFPAPFPLPPEDVPASGFKKMQTAASLVGVFSGWDIGFYAANIYSDQTYAELVSPGPPPQLVRKHARINMLGTAANLASGNWLLKAEAAWFDGIQFTNTPGATYSRLDLAGGLEYTGFSETTVNLEAVNRHIFDYDQVLKLPPDEIRENEFQWVLRFMRDFMNDTLTLTLVASTFGIKADDGAFERLDVEYEITDALSIRGGVILYQSGDKGIFQDVAANDRLFCVLNYNF